MEWTGWLCFMLILCYSSYPGKVKRLEKKVSKLEKNKNGGSEMSKIISELVGKRCYIIIDSEIQTKINCTVLDADDEWIKIMYLDKKNISKAKIVRIDSIIGIELIEE